MCEVAGLLASLASAGSLVLVSIGLITAAALANNGFFSAPSSPALMVAAGVAIIAAGAALSVAKALAEDYFQCMGAPDACRGALENFLTNIDALILVMGIQATASLAAASVAWIPWAGAAPMYAIIGTLVLQASLIPSLTAFWVVLEDCLERAATAATVGPLTASVPVYVATAFLLAIAAIGIAYYGRNLKKGPTIP